MYRTMLRIRVFEERVGKEFAAGNIPGFLHLYAGEEAVAVGACANLRPDDYITSTHRGHGHLIAKGGKSDKMMAELYGKKTGYNKGKGGSMHIADVKLGSLGANGIVGAGITIASGAALSSKLRKSGQVTACFFGDAASNTSRFHEGINLAAGFNLPAVFIIENNLYGISVRISSVCRLTNLSDKALAYGIPGVSVDGNDVLAVYEAVGEAVARARRGEGPTIVECKTFRRHGHWAGDNQAYIPKEEIEAWRKRDPIPKFRSKLIETGILSEDEAAGIEREIDTEIEEAVKFAESSPFPTPEETLDDVYAESDEITTPSAAKSGPVKTYLQAINEGTGEEMERDPKVFIFGQDLRALGAPRGEGPVRQIRGGQDTGRSRVRDRASGRRHRRRGHGNETDCQHNVFQLFGRLRR